MDPASAVEKNKEASPNSSYKKRLHKNFELKMAIFMLP